MFKLMETEDLFDSKAQVLVNCINIVGVMSKGIALEFKKRYPAMFEEYREACILKYLGPGRHFFWEIPQIVKKDSIKEYVSPEAIEDCKNWTPSQEQADKFFKEVISSEDLPYFYNKRYILNFVTKRNWRDQSYIEDIELELKSLVKILKDKKIKSIAIPALGCQNGGLKWSNVKPLIEESLKDLDILVELYPQRG